MFSVTFSISYENTVSECSLNIKNVLLQNFQKCVYLGNGNIKGTFHFIIVQTLWECYI